MRPAHPPISDAARIRSSLPLYASIAALLIAVQAVALYALGMPAICRCGYIALWHGNPSGPETSQHLTDWYTYTHVLHGFLFYALAWLMAPSLSIVQRFALAIGIESAWEVFENTPMVMERYRQGALAQGYFGDSIINSVADTLAAVVGYILAGRLPVGAIVAMVIAAEVVAGYFIRDGLALNIIQLVYPTEAVSRWQSGR
jgi:hypothetical protein